MKPFEIRDGSLGAGYRDEVAETLGLEWQDERRAEIEENRSAIHPRGSRRLLVTHLNSAAAKALRSDTHAENRAAPNGGT